MRFLPIVLVLLTTVKVFSAQPAVCTDLAKETCLGGPRTDVTGKSEAVDSKKFAADELVRIHPIVTAKFKSLITSPSGEALKEKIIEALPGQQSFCIANYNSEECNNFAAKALGDFYIVSETSPEMIPDFRGRFDAPKALGILLSPEYKKTAEATTAEQSGKLSPELVKKFSSEIYPDAKKYFISTIQNLSVDEKTKQEMIAKVKQIKPASLKCDPVFKTNSGLLQSLYPNAQYAEDNKEIGVCPAYLRFSTSQFDLTALIAHELAHSIDPCNLPSGMYDQERKVPAEMLEDSVVDQQYLKPNFISCLRSDTSIKALSFRTSLEELKRNAELEGEGDARGAYANSTARTCGTDQINESVADWFAAETVARFVESRKFTPQQTATGISNIYRSMCVGESSLVDVHPPMTSRLNSIFAAQPKIRTMMGCKSDAPNKKYCDINNPDSLKRINSPSKLNPKANSSSAGAKQ